MDVRGIEVTNQLRSAIRAKLLELGVRYDEELPDYILVMVVNKKSREQMHEDLNLFLETNTTPFVDWLHDQVLKKLQKVTIIKKKATREFVPTVIVKQEEERKKKRNTNQLMEKSKEESVDDKLLLKSAEDDCPSSNEIAPADNSSTLSPAPLPPAPSPSQSLSSPVQQVERLDLSTNNPSSQSEQPVKRIESVLVSCKRVSEREKCVEPAEKKLKPSDSSNSSLHQPDETEPQERRLKSCVNKPTVTSVVPVKTRLGFTLSGHRFQDQKGKTKFENRHYESANRRNIRGRNFEDEMKRNRNELNNRAGCTNDQRILGERLSIGAGALTRKSRIESTTGTIKDRLGQAPKLRMKDLPKDGVRNFRHGIRTATSKFRALGRLGMPRNRDASLFEEDGEADEDDDTVVPVKSHIIAVKSSSMEKGDRRNIETMRNLEDSNEKVEENDEAKVLTSKVIVTPRPLKPLQAVQKRATQSLLLRAVAEANQSVVQQKNPEPNAREKKPILKRQRTSGIRGIAQNLSVHLNASKRMVMEKIQVELTNSDTKDTEDPEPYIPRSVTEEHMGVVMSLFQKGDDNQKFLVTLNGYNKNGINQKNLSEEDEQLEVQVSEDDEFLQSNVSRDSSPADVETFETEELETPEKTEELENNENHFYNLAIEDSTRKPRKLSPIIYNRSPTPENINNREVSSVIPGYNKKPITSIIIRDTTKEQCRYWPNCTLGKTCAYVHPAIPCSAFPTCKFGDKCAYKHPKCRFGLLCTKPACAFSHSSQQCKYHPYCTKQNCTFLHSSVDSTGSADATRAKFTWRKRD